MPDVEPFDAAEHAPLAADGPEVRLRDVVADDAPLVHALFLATPGYFEAIGKPVPTESEIRTDLELAAHDERRHVLLALLDDDGALAAGPLPAAVPTDPRSATAAVGYVDYKADYPEPGDATVNLLLVHGALQSRGLGGAAVRALEARLAGRVRRVLASILGSNPRAKRFWQRLGYRFAIDARPVLEWYAKRLDG